jgi:phosphatidylglycerol:prolipoprotein diacylglycerol transferase
VVPGFLETATEPKLVVTCWFDPPAHPSPYTAVVQFTGSRTGANGRKRDRDHFVHEETVEVAVPDAGPVAVTARVGGVNPGEWEVAARILGQSRAERRRRDRAGPAGGGAPPPASVHRAAWTWLRWRLTDAPAEPVGTCLAPFARVPGLIPGAWAATAFAGVILGLALQALLAARSGLPVAASSAVAVLAVLVGIGGAKAWFVVLHRRERLWNGWCIQGLLTGVVLVLAAGSVVVHLPIGVFLDTAAPGLLLGMAVGRVGCFFGGCCVGRPTRSRWGVWSSDQRVGVRRIPTQLLEACLALVVGTAALLAVLLQGTANGAVFVAAAAGYTLCRQAILQLRAERRTSLLGPPLTAAGAALVLVADAMVLALTGGRGL